ncbi:ornithine cyclodeaminase [bacterium]|nr:ornithine cyclodeaminase [bacterium]MBU1676074.1 ornithine cyclodeaminase [bacterium]
MPLLLSRKDVEAVLSMDACLAAVETAFSELARGNADMPQRTVISVPGHKGLFLGMPAHIGGDDEVLGLKVVTVYPDNPGKGLPTIFGTLLLCDPTSGRTIAIMDAGYLTAVRTGAASGVATRYLAREDSKVCTIFGAGGQARKQLEAVHLVRPLEKIYVLDTVTGTRDAFVSEMGALLGVAIEAAEDAEAAVKAADIVVTASSSPVPVFDGDWLRPGTHVNNIGSHSPGARELDTRTIVRAKFVADLKEANLAEAGDILIPIAEGAVTEEHIHASLGEIVVGAKPGRENDEEITVFKSCGLAIQDVSSARVVYAAARAAGVGQDVEL